jgi:hypothetical protein
MILEGLLFLKNIKKDLFANPLHYHIKVFWIGFFTLTAAVQIFLCLDKRFKLKQILPAKPEPKKLK